MNVASMMRREMVAQRVRMRSTRLSSRPHVVGDSTKCKTMRVEPMRRRTVFIMSMGPGTKRMMPMRPNMEGSLKQHKGLNCQWKHGLNDTTSNDNSQLQPPGSGSGGGNPEHEYHVDTCRDVGCRDVTIHDRSKDGSDTTTTLPGGNGEAKLLGRMWRSSGQLYKVKPWSEADKDQDGMAQARQQLDERSVASLMVGRSKVRRRQPYESEDEDSESEEDQLVCNMTGSHWEDLQFPVIIDSGVCAFVMPTDWCGHVGSTSAPQSRAKEPSGPLTATTFATRAKRW